MKCQTGKIIRTEEEAKLYVYQFSDTIMNNELSYYKCEFCKKYHITKKNSESRNYGRKWEWWEEV